RKLSPAQLIPTPNLCAILTLIPSPREAVTSGWRAGHHWTVRCTAPSCGVPPGGNGAGGVVSRQDRSTGNRLHSDGMALVTGTPAEAETAPSCSGLTPGAGEARKPLRSLDYPFEAQGLAGSHFQRKCTERPINPE